MIEVPVENIYHFIWGFDRTHAECLINGNFKIVPISKSPVVSYLNGNTEEYLSQSHLFVVREASIKYLLNQYDVVICSHTDDRFYIRILLLEQC